MADPCPCVVCLGKATKILERAELGQAPERLTVCDGKDCQPTEGEWSQYAIDTPTPTAAGDLGAA